MSQVDIDKEYALFYDILDEVGAAQGFLQGIDLDLRRIAESSQYDEPHKLGPKPDIEAIREVKKLLEKAQGKLAAFFDSVKNQP